MMGSRSRLYERQGYVKGDVQGLEFSGCLLGLGPLALERYSGGGPGQRLWFGLT